MIDGVIPSGQGLAASFGVAGAGNEADAAPSLNLDADAYLPMLAGYDLTDEQAREMLTALWSIMRGFVELGIRRRCLWRTWLRCGSGTLKRSRIARLRRSFIMRRKAEQATWRATNTRKPRR